MKAFFLYTIIKYSNWKFKVTVFFCFPKYFREHKNKNRKFSIHVYSYSYSPMIYFH